jgi:hypothetical protein
MKIEKSIILLICIIIFSCKKEEDKLVFEIGDDFQFSHKHLIYFTDLVWKDSLTSKDLNTINNAFFSPHCNTKGEGRFINNEELILVHRINLIQKKDTAFYWERFNKYITQSKDFDDKEYDEFLFSQISEEELFKKIWTSHTGPSNSEIFLNALVIRQVKQLRTGKKSNIILPDSLISNYKNLIYYSQFPKEEAIDSLVSILLDKTSNNRLNNSQSLEALKTYNNHNSIIIKKVYDSLNDSSLMKNMDGYIKLQLPYFLIDKVESNITTKEKIELNKLLNKK